MGGMCSSPAAAAAHSSAAKTVSSSKQVREQNCEVQWELM